jgi:hypothetical protein
MRVTSSTPLALIVEAGTDMAQHSIMRSFARHVDVVIKANSAPEVIPSTKAIAVEVMKQQQRQNTEYNGNRHRRERWTEHQNEANKIREAGITYRNIDNGGREVVKSSAMCVTHTGFMIGTRSYPRVRDYALCGKLRGGTRSRIGTDKHWTISNGSSCENNVGTALG